jgi:hypothetical protein
MTTEITKNLKLRIPDNSSQDARFNLKKIDDFAGAYSLEENGSLIISSRDAITILPEARAKGGAGEDGVLNLGTLDEVIDVVFNTVDVKMNSGYKLKNTLGNNYLQVSYISSDTQESSLLLNTFDQESVLLSMDGDLVISNDFSTQGGYSISLTATETTSVTLPPTGELVSTDAIQTIENKTLIVADNTVTVSAGELNTVLQNMQTDINSKADNGGFNSHTVASGGVHGVLGSLVGTTDSQVLTNKIISGTFNNLTNIAPSSFSSTSGTGAVVLASNASLNSPIITTPSGLNKTDVGLSNVDNTSDSSKNAAVAILTNKTISGSNNTISNISLTSSIIDTLPISNGGTGQTSANAALNAFLPPQTGNTNYVLQTDGTNTSWQPAGGGTVTSVDLAVPSEFSISGSPITTSGTITVSKVNQNANLVYSGPSTGAAAAPTFRALVDDDIPDAASFIGKTTDDLSEGATNFYYTEVKFDASLATKDSDDLDEGSTNLYFTEERVDDRVASLVVDGTGISTTYDDVAGTLTFENTSPDQTVVLNEGAGIDVTGTYPNFTIASTITQYTDELAQDAVFNALTDTSSIDFAYNDIANTITASVLPAGVDHDALQNFVANEHIDHSSVSISTSATSGLAGGGNLTSTRNLSVSPSSATLEAPASADEILFADASDSSNLKKTTIQSILDLGGGKFTATWAPGDGTSKAVTHSFGITSISFNIFDIDTGEEIWVDTAMRTDVNTLTLTSSVAPSGSGWQVVIRK